MLGLPAAVGWNSTLNDTLCPAANTSGKVMPVTEKPEPNPRIELIVIAADVLFESVSATVLLLPIGTAPKAKLPLPTPTVPPPFVPERPWHPVSSNRLPATIMTITMTRKVAK